MNHLRTVPTGTASRGSYREMVGALVVVCWRLRAPRGAWCQQPAPPAASAGAGARLPARPPQLPTPSAYTTHTCRWSVIYSLRAALDADPAVKTALAPASLAAASPQVDIAVLPCAAGAPASCPPQRAAKAQALATLLTPAVAANCKPFAPMGQVGCWPAGMQGTAGWSRTDCVSHHVCAGGAAPAVLLTTSCAATV